MRRIGPERPAKALLLLALAGGLALLATAAAAQEVRIDLGAGQSLTLRTVEIFLLLTVLSLAPGLAIMVTCFPFMVTVLSILRSALGTQQAPPNMMIVALAIFLTWFVMEPVFTRAWDDGVEPMIAGTLTPEEAFAPAIAPFRAFMETRADPDTIATLRDAMPSRDAEAAPGAEPPLSLLIPAFLLGEIKRGFEVGFLVFLPFLVIDLVIAAILMSMGMMMVPPAMVSLPFKLAFFVIADGWTLLGGALVRSYGQ
ncbi:flagellar type III secretion system pore protein FliP [Amaricoccus solimangrovi]|uniref:Flagellar biosynthetic protein FliP n=1 Tax=Amaricoccus solimangrovi TaxID=2589815 RepID=A0A501WZK8_9RHOB|nr:flagellar type III secretion system pore protein FliP [Amaricoccus solimangrovi]TPE53835.1 flagellar type III secretion system pore protein FliP [Amaricoccus solimangrovi]